MQPTYGNDFLNVSKIITVEEHCNLLSKCEYIVDVPWRIVEELYNCVVDNTYDPKEIYGKFVQFKRNLDKSILDMQGIFSRLPCKSQRYNYIAPMLYMDAYINGIEYPKPLSEDEYTEGLNQIENQKRQEWKQKFEAEWNSWANAHVAEELHLLTLYPKDRADSIWEEKRQLYLRERFQRHHLEIEKDVSNAKKDYAYELKYRYYIKTRHYLFASCYAEAVRKNGIVANLGKNIKMYSTDTLGFTHFKYPISEDVVIKLHTNFGYGVASYFRLELTYKEIPILPYSYYVSYYYANSRDLSRYTRLYNISRESWPLAFKFVVETSNLAAQDPERFVREWVMNEVRTMLDGLKSIMTDPHAYMEPWLDKINQNTIDKESPYLTVRFMDNAAASEYKCYPDEMAIDFKAKKISGALEFLDSLKALKSIYADVDRPIEEIKKLGRDILPEIGAALLKIQYDIKRLEDKLYEEQKLRKSIEAKILVFETSFKSVVETELAKVNHDQWSKYELESFEALLMSEFERNNPEFVEQKKNRDSCLEEETRYETDMQHRKRFVESLEQCRTAILSHPGTRIWLKSKQVIEPATKQSPTLHAEYLQAYVYIDKDFRTGYNIFRIENNGTVYHAHSQHSADVVLKVIGGVLNKETLVFVKHREDDGTEVEWLRIKFPLKMTIRVDGEDNRVKLCTILSAEK